MTFFGFFFIQITFLEFMRFFLRTDDFFQEPADENQSIPALDNGQLAWSILAADYILRRQGYTNLADRFGAHLSLMKASAPTLFLQPDGGCAPGTTILDPKQPVRPCDNL